MTDTHLEWMDELRNETDKMNKEYGEKRIQLEADYTKKSLCDLAIIVKWFSANKSTLPDAVISCMIIGIRQMNVCNPVL